MKLTLIFGKNNGFLCLCINLYVFYIVIITLTAYILGKNSWQYSVNQKYQNSKQHFYSDHNIWNNVILEFLYNPSSSKTQHNLLCKRDFLGTNTIWTAYYLENTGMWYPWTYEKVKILCESFRFPFLTSQ
jgi:hypothetical protein